MKKLATTLPALLGLDLTFDSGPSSGVFFSNFALNLDLSKMTKLYLQSIYVDVSPLGMALCKLSSIKDLRLVFINLTKGNWVTILKAIQKLTGHLTHLHLMYLLEAQRKVYFLKQIEREDMPDSYFDDDDGFLPGDHLSDGEFGSDEDDEDDDSGDDTDDEMPSLEPLNALSIATENAVNAQPDSSSDEDEDESEEDESDESDEADGPVPPPLTEQTPTLGQTNTTAQTNTNGPSGPLVDYQIPPYLDPSHSSDDHSSPNSPETGERG